MGLKGVLVPLASVAVLLCAAAGLRAEEPGVSTDPTTDPTAAPRPIAELDRLGAHGAVREGNRLLLEGDAASALEAYRHAKNLRPDAAEIPFVEGLAYYAQKEYDSARNAFEKAALSEDRSLSDDALYSIGTTYHAQAFETLQDPKAAIEKLESAMQRYRAVLANQPDHRYARDANLKAASVRRRLKQMLEQQQRQSQQQNENSDQGDEDQESRERQDQGEKQQKEQQDDGQRSGSEDQQEQQDARPESSDQDDQQQAQPSEEDQEERVSREQAERRLREMMQALREREKQRHRQVRKTTLAPVDKDW